MKQNVSETDLCPCLEAGTHFCGFEKKVIGVDDRYGEVSVWTCKKCGRNWLHYFIEYEYLEAAGRMFTGLISPDVAAGLKAHDAIDLFDSMPWYFRGGSAFGGELLRIQGPIQVWLTPFSGK